MCNTLSATIKSCEYSIKQSSLFVSPSSNVTTPNTFNLLLVMPLSSGGQTIRATRAPHGGPPGGGGPPGTGKKIMSDLAMTR